MMVLRWARRVGAMAAIIVALATLAALAPGAMQSIAQTLAQTTTPPTAAPVPPPDQTAQPGDAFGENATLPSKTIVFIKGNGTWDKAFPTISSAMRKLEAYVDKEGLKTDGLPLTVFTATDDTGFTFQAAIPIAEAPKKPPQGGIALGQSPNGEALKFVHRGSYDALDNTYEAITNYLDDKRIDAQDMFIEEYVTDPAVTDASKLVVNVYVLLKGGQSPG